MASPAQKRRRQREIERSSPAGWGTEQLEQRAEKSRQIMARFDSMPPEFRVLANEYGMKVRVLMRDGLTVDQIRRECTSFNVVRT